MVGEVGGGGVRDGREEGFGVGEKGGVGGSVRDGGWVGDGGGGGWGGDGFGWVGDGEREGLFVVRSRGGRAFESF